MKDQSVRDLVADGNLRGALKKIRKFIENVQDRESEYLIYNSRLESYEDEHRKGTMQPAEVQYEKNRLSNNILDFYDLLEKDVLTFSVYKKIEITAESFEQQLRRKLSRLYEIQEALGSGGTSIIYKANEYSSRQRVAIRAFKNQDFSVDEDEQKNDEDLAVDMEKILQLRHRNIKKISAEFLGDFPACYTETFIDGPTLNKILRYGPWPVTEVKDIAVQLADALYYLHTKKLLHHRLRPSKVFVDSEGAPMISPFEKFTFRFKTFSLEKAQGDLMYLSPEQLDERVADDKADQFSLGLVIYELLKGRPLFYGETIPEVFRRRDAFFNNSNIRNQAFRELPVPTKMKQMLKRMLAYEPTARFPDLKEISEICAAIKLPLSLTHVQVRESYRRCRAANACFTKDFYVALLATGEDMPEGEQTLTKEISAIFDQAGNPSSDYRERMLKSAIELLISSHTGENYLHRIAKIPAHMAAKQAHYQRFLSVLIDTVAENDYLWNDQIKTAWDEIALSTLKLMTPQKK